MKVQSRVLFYDGRLFEEAPVNRFESLAEVEQDVERVCLVVFLAGEFFGSPAVRVGDTLRRCFAAWVPRRPLEVKFAVPVS